MGKRKVTKEAKNESTSIVNPRDKIRQHINKLIKDENITFKIERSIYNKTLEIAKEKDIDPSWGNQMFRRCYISISKTIYVNLDNSSYVKNKKFIELIKSGKINAEKVGFMTPQEMFPEQWKLLMDDKFKRDAHMFEIDKSGATDQFLCRKCKKRECVFYEMQTRSADEPMSIFITCLNCGNKWRE
jgi:DNA-directed RNA polymerase subunit M/transcription elongation factor TFIIS